MNILVAILVLVTLSADTTTCFAFLVEMNIYIYCLLYEFLVLVEATQYLCCDCFYCIKCI